MLEDYCSPQEAYAFAQRILECPRIKEAIANNETKLRFGAELQGDAPGATVAEIEEFKPEFEALRVWLENRYSAKIEYHPQMPLPGFHIFTSSAIDGGKPHADGQAFSAANYIGARFLSVWSIVVVLNMPKTGGGIHFWKKSLYEIARQRGNLSNPMPEHDFTVKLEPGKILLFDSEQVHQIQGYEIETLDEARVTLVAHLGEIEPGRYIYFFDRLKNVRKFFGIEADNRFPGSGY